MTIRIGQSQVYASVWGSDNVVGNLRGVHWELAEGIGSLPGWRKGVHQKKTKTHRKIIGGSRKACWEFTEGIGNLARKTLGDHRRKTVRLVVVESGGCRTTGVSCKLCGHV
ncbi:hypothetical protein BHE74_00006775 [Ensete ventricosum]|nr:hypothetical protein BHE74_00006775 [Ensete ventricosum]RZS08610.1 hypothetical protein BHM03_00039604 [Ensete ventricosum]